MGNASDPIRLDRLLLSLSGTLSDSPGHVMLCAENGLLLASRGGLGADHGRPPRKGFTVLRPQAPGAHGAAPAGVRSR